MKSVTTASPVLRLLVAGYRLEKPVGYHSFFRFFLFFFQYAAKEFQQALDILDAEEPASKKLLDRSLKEDSVMLESAKDWDMSPASVSLACHWNTEIYWTA